MTKRLIAMPLVIVSEVLLAPASSPRHFGRRGQA